MDIINLPDLKNKIARKEQITGLKFVNSKGSIGIVLEMMSTHQKRQAEMTCTVSGCVETHIREQSDWHQSHTCRTHKSKSNSKIFQPIFWDGNEYRYSPILPTDNSDTVSDKELANLNYQSAKDQLKAESKAENAKKAEEKKAKRTAERAERSLKIAEEKKAALQAQINGMKDYSAKVGIPVSAKALASGE